MNLVKRYVSVFLLVALLFAIAPPATAAQSGDATLSTTLVKPVPPNSTVIDITQLIGKMFQKAAVYGTVTQSVTRIGPIVLKHYQISGTEYRPIGANSAESIGDCYIIVPIDVPVKLGRAALSGYTLPFSIADKRILVLYSGKISDKSHDGGVPVPWR